MDKEKQDPKTWALANAVKANKKKKKNSYLDDLDIDDIDLLDDDEMNTYLEDYV